MQASKATDEPISVCDVVIERDEQGNVVAYSVEIACRPFDEHRLIQQTDSDLMVHEAHLQIQRWWGRLTEQRNAPVVQDARGPHLAVFVTEWAQRQLAMCTNILNEPWAPWSLTVWEALAHFHVFKWQHERTAGVHYDAETGEPESCDLLPALTPVFKTDKAFEPSIEWWDHLVPSWKRSKLQVAEKAFQNAYDRYEAAQQERERANAELSAKFGAERAAYESASNAEEARRVRILAKVDGLKKAWTDGVPDAVARIVRLGLESAIAYPVGIPGPRIDACYLPESRMVIVDYELPAQSKLPTLEQVNFIKSRNATTEKHLSDTTALKRYDSMCYQIVLKVIESVFGEDQGRNIDSVTVNGWVEATNTSTGHLERSCIASLQTDRESFESISLSNVDPKACFRSLKGVSAVSLAAVTAVRPILDLNRSDSRFVAERSVVGEIDDRMNLAAMDWEDFEHLVREIFSQEFSGQGAEVKVTQASRDGGVDAVVLDPDPIKGGKIIIQAKRYTGAVSVSAVRDLYGTVMSEGANRGILVTTASYGPDAYKFALGKPLSLLDGSQLLFLLEKHGHKAMIDLQAARREFHSQ